MDEEITDLRHVFLNIERYSAAAWLYLPQDQNWNLSSKSTVLESEEVPPEQVDTPDAEVPQFAKDNSNSSASCYCCSGNY
jgi:hypothetical protein